MLKNSIKKRIKWGYEPRVFRLLNKSEDLSYTEGQRKGFLQQYHEAEKNFTVAHFYFKELTMVKYQRDELYGLMDVLGNSNFLC